MLIWIQRWIFYCLKVFMYFNFNFEFFLNKILCFSEWKVMNKKSVVDIVDIVMVYFIPLIGNQIYKKNFHFLAMVTRLCSKYQGHQIIRMMTISFKCFWVDKSFNNPAFLEIIIYDFFVKLVKLNHQVWVRDHLILVSYDKMIHFSCIFSFRDI